MNVAAFGPICLGGYKRLEVSSVVCLLLPPQPSQQIITVIGLCRLKNANSAWAEKDDFPAKATLAEKDDFPAKATLAKIIFQPRQHWLRKIIFQPRQHWLRKIYF